MAGLGSTPGIIVGVGVGAAAAAAIEPVVELPRQAAWRANPVRLLDPAVMARLVASGGVDLGVAQDDGKGEGYGEDKINALVYLAQTVPGLSEAIIGLNRKTITPADFDHTLVKAALDARYYAAIEDLANTWLSPQQVALGIVRGTIPDPGILPVTLDTTGTIKGYPQFTENKALDEAAGGGIDLERLTVMVGSIGLPMSLQQAASAVFRSILVRGDFNRAVLEGDTRPEWADAIFEQARQILSADQYAELQLRGFYDRATRLKNTEKHGMSDDDSDLLFDVLGRGLSEHQMVIAKARGGIYNGPIDQIPADELAALQRANLRPEFYNLAYAARYTYPSGFQIKAEVVGKNLTQQQGNDILLEVGWDPKWATVFSTAWAGGATTTAAQKKQTLSHLIAEYLSGALTVDALTTTLTTGLGYTAQQAADEIALANFNAAKSSRTKATKNLEKRYIGATLSEADARSQLAGIGWPEGAIDQFIASWNIERADTLTTLTLAQIQTALKNAAIPASVARPLLEDLGESDAAIATIFATYGTDPNT